MRLWCAVANGNSFLILNDAPIDEAHEYLNNLRQTDQWDFDSALVLAALGDGSIRMQILEKDGSESAMCGNGLLAVTTLLGMRGDETIIEVNNTRYVPEQSNKGYRISIAVMRRGVLQMPTSEGLLIPWTIYEIGGEPHGVAMALDCAAVMIERWGMMMKGVANCTIVSLDGKGCVQARTFERGVNRETQSCGTGAIAAARYLFDMGIAQSPFCVLMNGSTLRVHMEHVRAALEGKGEVVETTPKERKNGSQIVLIRPMGVPMMCGQCYATPKQWSARRFLLPLICAFIILL